MEKRLVSSEFNAVKRLAAVISELHYSLEDLKTHWEMIDNGQERIKKSVNELLQLFDEILDTIPQKQLKSLRNAMDDYKIALVPQMKAESKSVLFDKDQAKELVDLAHEKCKTCVNSPEEAEKCALFHLSTAIVPPDRYDSLLCPYSSAEWGD